MILETAVITILILSLLRLRYRRRRLRGIYTVDAHVELERQIGTDAVDELSDILANEISKEIIRELIAEAKLDVVGKEHEAI